ncbi:MAG: phytanoyl-CoA dioxygenase family protein [bacterium]|nr:phytanoyl-CoA dioxygenase family protein [bacterium]
MATVQIAKLTSEELSTYHEQGYVLLHDVFPKDELEAMDREMDRIQATQEDLGRNPGWVMQLGLRSEVTQQFARDERVLTLIEDIVKPGISIFSGKLTAKSPRSDEICHWHQDDAYYNAQAPSETRMSTWIPLQDTDEENGCMWVVPGSHKGGVVAHGPYGGQCPKCMGSADLMFDDAILCPVKMGDMLLFSACLWHHSKGNRTDRVRRAFIVSYQEATVPRGNGKQYTVLRPAN